MKIISYFFSVALLVFSAVFLVACDSSESARSKKAETKQRLTVVCTTGMIGDLVTAIAGEHAQVKTLIGSGIDPHLYKATRSDIVTLTSADLVFANGLYLEGKMTDALARVKAGGVPLVILGETVDASMLRKPAEFEGHYDPHLWMAPRLWKQIIPAIEKALGKVSPEHRESFKKNAARYALSLDALHSFGEISLQSIPEQSRVLVTAHDAFGYFGEAYGIEVVGVQGLSTESEAGIQDIERIVSLLVERDVKAVFVESTISEKNVTALIEGAKARGKEVAIGGTLYSDALGSAGTPEGTYRGMILHNIETITTALGGRVPPRPAIIGG